MQMQGCCWPLSAGAGEQIEFRTATTAEWYRVTIVRFDLTSEEVTGETIFNGGELVTTPVSLSFNLPGRTQDAVTPSEGCVGWDVGFAITVDPSWPSGIYAARLDEVEDDTLGETFFVVFVVNPPADGRNSILVLANTSTWNAYNDYGGDSRYTVADDSSFSFLRPNPYTVNPTIPDNQHSPLTSTRDASDPTRPRRYFVNEATRHLTRSELWLLGWLQREGFGHDVYTDLDLHVGIDRLEDYRLVVLSTHPEYMSIPMREALDQYVAGGGNLAYLGGNGIFDAVEISDDLLTMSTFGCVDAGTRSHMFRQPTVGRPEAALLGVAYEANSPTSQGFPFQVEDGQLGHPVLVGTGLISGAQFGREGWQTKLDLSAPQPLSSGGACGWEIDVLQPESPDLDVLAIGVNQRAVMAYHESGGFVFAGSSIKFVGALMVDGTLMQIIRNVIGVALSSGKPGRDE